MSSTERADDPTTEPTSAVLMKGINLGLARIQRLLSSLGNPHLAVPIVHVAGTNGKGSVCAYLDSILRASRLRVGRYTSPHLVQVHDTINLHGATISLQDYRTARAFVDSVDRSEGIGCSSFELLTATAFEAFRRADPPLDVAVVEVGLGGETDATNVCPAPLVTVITSVDLDHQAILGNTVGAIARVKAGIIKDGVPCVLAPQNHTAAAETVTAVAEKHNAPLIRVEAGKPSGPRMGTFTVRGEATNIKVPLPGAYQLANAATAIAAAELLPFEATITRDAIAEGLANTVWAGRLDWVHIDGREALLDGAHNPAALEALRRYLDSLDPKPTTFLVALSAPREPATLLEPLLRGARSAFKVVATTFSAPEGMDWVTPVEAQVFAGSAKALGCTDFRAVDNVAEALRGLDMDTKSERLVICGSLYLIADVYRYLR